MTQDEIIEMAREAGLYQDINVSFHQALRNFYDLAAAKVKTQPEQEPWCMKMNGCKTKCEDCPDEPLDICCQQYDTCLKPCTPRGVHLAQRTWVGLTNQEAMDVTRKEGHELLDFIYEYGTGVEGVEERIVAICKAIEAKLKENNT
jgi:methionyl-tRNA synthetase